MGLFDLFGKTDDLNSVFVWHEVTSEPDVEQIISDSAARPQILFKNSTRCGISRMARTRLEKLSADEQKGLDFHILDVIASRPVSLFVAKRFGISHESPQIFVIKNGEVIWSASHGGVTKSNVLQALK